LLAPQLAPNLFLLKQKTSNPLGFIYSIENGRKKDYEFTMNFAGSKNVRLEGGGGADNVKEVIAPGETKMVATAVQANLSEGIAIKTSMGVKELRTSSAPAPQTGLKGPAGASMKRAVKNYSAREQGEMSVQVSPITKSERASEASARAKRVRRHRRDHASAIRDLPRPRRHHQRPRLHNQRTINDLAGRRGGSGGLPPTTPERQRKGEVQHLAGSWGVVRGVSPRQLPSGNEKGKCSTSPAAGGVRVSSPRQPPRFALPLQKDTPSLRSLRCAAREKGSLSPCPLRAARSTESLLSLH
jgi:hypothetical protein